MPPVTNVSGAGPVTAAPGAPARPGAAGFVVDIGLDRAARLLAATPAAALDAMLALQEAEAEATRDRNARRHGRALLDALAELQCALLAESGAGDGQDGPVLQRLAGLLEASPGAADPALAGVLRALSLRAQVELARRGM
jgi:Class II flagellar assembly regulator